MKDIIVPGIIISMVFIVLCLGLISAVDRSDHIRCIKLQEQAETYKDFYITKLEKEMCDYKGVMVNAEVK